MKERYYYLRNDKNEPVLTACLLKKEGQVARGLAICSLRDSPCKRIGRAIAKGRAEKALREKKDSGFIFRKEVYKVFCTLNSACYGNYVKAAYAPDASYFEEKLLEKGEGEENEL